ncbi:hypothetical protein BK133_13885 [Paenibacillus sp. FSL H8-0548]|uniref:hypothetical protein n=1 Tax=Paenibacillus sp. FSL H8-0548 TaxID=1920422 RepID=UPI00096F22FE|nr:hypothetical protein [Paenibacillus sp. FSL H8-0548]OMF32594.1 hypothetical protein BK133_13885 [Paenibacillus sp. FSL H8-0548]
MRKKKWKKIIIWAVSIIVILGVGGLFAANYAVNKLISSLSASLENDILNEVSKANVDNQEAQGDEPVTGTVDGDAAEGIEEGTDTGDKNNDQTDPSKETGTVKSGDGYQAEVSIDKAKDVQEKITVSEKAQLTSVFLKQLSMSDIQELQALAKGGLGTDEKKQARSIILAKLTPEQYDELIQIAKKYGMSQGKTYDQVSSEK